MRYLVVAFIVLLLVSITTLLVSAASANGHGCAPQTPPVIPGFPGPAPAVSGFIDLNEVLLTPQSTWNCSETSGTYSTVTDSWIELYDTQNQPFNLYAAHAVIDSGPGTNFYYFPFGASIAAHSFLVVFPRTNASFTATETPTLRLIIGSVVVSQVTVPQLGRDQAYARTSDGASSWQFTSTPTIDASNRSLQVTPTPNPTASSNSGGSGSRGSGSSATGSYTTHGSSSKALVNGVQPRWSGLQLPDTTPTSAPDIGTFPTTHSSSPSQSSAGLDLPRKVALTLLAMALAVTLFWGWRLFRKFA